VPLRRLAGALALAVIALSGCSDDSEPAVPDGTATATSEEPTEPSDTGTSTPPEPTEPSQTATPTQEEPSNTATPEPTPEPTDEPTSPPQGLRAALLTAQALPAPGDLAWTSTRTTRGDGGEDVSVCQVSSLEAIGASRAVTRRFTSATVSATQVVAQFVDEVGSSGGFDILQAWLSRCAQQAGAAGFESVQAPKRYSSIQAGDAAGWALVTYGPVPDDPDAAFIEAQALVRAGDTLSWVVWEETGQDYNYPAGQTPPERAVPLLAQALGAS